MAGRSDLGSQFRARVQSHPHKIALWEPIRIFRNDKIRWRSITFEELEDLSGRYANGLAQSGVRQGDRTLYLLPPSIDSFAVLYGLLKLGAVPVFIDPRMGLRHVLTCMQSARPRVVVGAPLAHLVRVFAGRAFSETEVLITSGPRIWKREHLLQQIDKAEDFGTDAPSSTGECMLPFTSGSTGPAKGVLFTNEMVTAQISLLREVSGWTEDTSVVICFAPFVPLALADGHTTILPDIDFTRPAAIQPERVIEAVADHGAESLFASPIVWMKVVAYCEQNGLRLGSIKSAVAAGAPVQGGLHRRLAKIIHDEGTLFTPYGSTEAMPATSIATEEIVTVWDEMRLGYGTCVGKPVSGVEVRIIRVTDESIPTWSDDLRLPQGEIGEVVVSGAVVSPAYPLDPAQTALAKINRNGSVLHRMGDLGRLDSAGRLWFCGRKSQRIETAEGMLPTVPIENIINEHPSVFRSAVVGVGRRGKQIAVACIETTLGHRFSGQLESELARIADGTRYEGVVTRFLPYSRFPVDARHNSKIRREDLARWAERRLADN